MTSEPRATIFGGRASDYDRFRPGYPAAAIDAIVADDPTVAVDVGCGTGKAAVLVARRGVEVVGVEPDERMADVARRHGVTVTVARFEDWVPVPCDVMYSAQAWHWVDPIRGADVAAQSVRSGGRWVGVWNYERDDAWGAARNEAYERVAPDLLDDAVVNVEQGDDHLLATIDAGLHGTGHFERIVPTEVTWADRLTVADAIARLGTHSAHRLLEPDLARAIDDAIVDRLGDPSMEISLRYLTRILTAQRR